MSKSVYQRLGAVWKSDDQKIWGYLRKMVNVRYAFIGMMKSEVVTL